MRRSTPAHVAKSAPRCGVPRNDTRLIRLTRSATRGSVMERSVATRSACWRISPPKLCTTNAMSPCASRGSASSSARTLVARSTSGMACPRHRVGAESCLMLHTPRPGMSSASQRGHSSDVLPDDSQTVELANRTPWMNTTCLSMDAGSDRRINSARRKLQKQYRARPM